MSAKSATLASRLHLDIVILPEALSGLGLCLVDALRVVNTVIALQDRSPTMRASWQWVDDRGQPVDGSTAPGAGPSTLAPHLVSAPPAGMATRDDEAAVHALVIPPILASHVPALRKIVAAHAALAETVQARLNAGYRVVTFGSGLWFAAGAVQAAKRTFTVPWFFMNGFTPDFPHAVLQGGHAVVQDGPFISVASLDGWVEACLTLLAAAYPDEFVQTVRATLAFDATRQAAAVHATSGGKVQPTRDSVLALAIEWLSSHQEEAYDLPVLAAACKVSGRTLLRHFDQVLGMSPLDYLHRQRCQRASFLLETTLQSVHSIAQSCGYADASGLRKVFLRHVGCSPQAYRSQRRLRTSRARWKTDAVVAAADKAPGTLQPE